MKKTIKKRGQKIVRRVSRFSKKASQEGKEHLKENFFGRISHIRDIKLLIAEWSLLVVAVILLAITQAIWFNNSYSTETFADGGTYTEGTIGKINSMNPLFASNESEKVLSRLMFETLTTIDTTGHVAPGLAKSITPTNNGKTWLIELRENLKWSDGKPITNADVIFTTSLIKNSAVTTIYDANLTGVKVSETEDGKIQFDLPTVYADFASALNFPIVPEHILKDVDPKNLLESQFSASPIVSGPFTFNAVQKSSKADEQVIYLNTNKNYYKHEPLLNSFAVHTFLTKEALVNALNSGTISATASLSPADAELITSSDINEKQTAINSGVFAFFNINSEILKNKDFRIGIKQAINLDIIRGIAKDQPVLDYPLLESQIKLKNYPELTAYNQDEASKKFDPVIDAAGEAGITLNLATVNSGYLPAVAEEFANELREYGINVNISVYEENQEFISNIISKRNYDILIYEIELGAEPDIFTYYHSSQAGTSGHNLSNYKNFLIDDLILGARETINADLRASKYESFIYYWTADVPAIALYQTNLSYFHNKNVRAFSDENILTTPLDRFRDVEFWSSHKSTKNRTP